jgi:hypothetical protein
MDFDYKKYSLENLEKWMGDALTSSEATPQEIYDVIHKVVEEEYHYFKHHTGRCYDLLALLNGNGKGHIPAYDEYVEKKDKLTCDKDDQSEECKNPWTSFWEENYYPEGYEGFTTSGVDDILSYSHSDMEYGLANDTLTRDRISNFPGEQYSEEELNAMCDKAASDQEKQKCREYNLREAEYYDKRARLDAKKDKVVKWQLPIEIDGLSGEYYVNFPDDLMEASGIKENDMVEWVNRGDGSYLLRKVTKPIGMEEC